MEYRKQAGRDHLPFIVTASFGYDRDSVERARDLGVDRVMVTPSGAMGQRIDQQFYRDVIARFADEVITRI
jgi:hypothetical protein